MATFAPPTKTTPEDINVVVGFLKSQIGWTSVEALRKRLPSKHTGARKIDAMRYLGLIERDGDNVKLTGDGRSYADADPAGQATAIAERIREIPLYHATVEWLHYTHRKDVATKTDVANHWHDSLSEESAGVTGDSLGDASVFFLRVADLAGLGKFTAAGVGRETHLEIDRENLAAFVAAEPPPKEAEQPKQEEAPTLPPAAPPPAPTVSVGAGINVNVEIHIAADAKPATIEEIFKNMRKYLLQQGDVPSNGG